MIWMGPTGNLIKGSVLDVNKKHLERALKDYDQLLYIKWNPKKNKGNGVWEIRRRPLLRSIIDVAPMGDKQYIVRAEYIEQNIVHHVLDCPVLDYKILDRLQEMDLFQYNQHYFVDQAEKRLDEYKVEQKAKARKEMLYNAKQHRSTMQYIRERLLSGMNPAEIARYWNQ